MATRPGYMYRLYDDAGQLLYIGRSATPESRIAIHRRCTAGWQTEIDHWEIEPFASISAAIRGQRRATAAERPLHVDVTLDLADRPVWVYRIYDTEAVLQYIGQTTDVGHRIWTHQRQGRFTVATWTTEKLPNREAANVAEKAAIEAERPLWNKRGGGAGEGRQASRFDQQVALTGQLLEQLARGEVTYRAAIEEQVLAGLDIWKAADKLGLKIGWPNHRRKCPTVDTIMALNGLS